MLRQVHLADWNTEDACDFIGRPLFFYIKIKNLVLLRINRTFDVGDCSFEQILFPFGLPKSAQVLCGGIDYFVQCAGSGGSFIGKWPALGERFAPADLVPDAPT